MMSKTRFEKDHKENYRVNNARITNRKRFGDISYVYLINAIDTDFYKIGVSNKPDRRLKDIHSHIPFDIDVLVVVKCEDAYSVESKIHKEYSQQYVKSEWFKFSPKQVVDAIFLITSYK